MAVLGRAAGELQETICQVPLSPKARLRRELAGDVIYGVKAGSHPSFCQRGGGGEKRHLLQEGMAGAGVLTVRD